MFVLQYSTQQLAWCEAALKHGIKRKSAAWATYFCQNLTNFKRVVTDDCQPISDSHSGLSETESR